MLLFVVEQVFQITGQGVVLLPGLGQNIVGVGKPIRLFLPDGAILNTHIRGITFNQFKDILLGNEIRKMHAPIGTEFRLEA